MAYSFLDVINRSLKRVGIIQGEAGELSSFTDSPRQTEIDIMIQAWNETIADLFDTGILPKEAAEGTITLVTNTREYDPPSDFEGFITNPLQETDGYLVTPYDPYAQDFGYRELKKVQLVPDDYTGRPLFWTINPVNGKVYFDQIPTSEENGDVYTFDYTKRTNLDTTTDTFPFSDSVADALLPAVKEIWNRERKKEFDGAAYQFALARAANAIRPGEPRDRY